MNSERIIVSRATSSTDLERCSRAFLRAGPIPMEPGTSRYSSCSAAGSIGGGLRPSCRALDRVTVLLELQAVDLVPGVDVPGVDPRAPLRGVVVGPVHGVDALIVARAA